MKRSHMRRGYTLRDLMIVILILCALLALALPMIRASREAARRAQCTNNLKNISLGLLNYHDTYKTFPMGAMHAGARLEGEPPNDSKLGPSWWYGILPFVEQINVYDQICATQRPGGPVNNQFCARDMIAAGVSRNSKDGRLIGTFAKFSPVYMRCPASPLPAFETKAGPIYLPTYAGITGGCDIDPKSQDYANADVALVPRSSHPNPYRNGAKGTGAVPGSIVTTSGMLPPCEHIAMRNCTDGTPNTIIVAEQSDWLRDPTPGASASYHGDAGWTVGGTSAGGGWLSGTTRCDPVSIASDPNGAPMPWEADCWNLTTVRYPLNHKSVIGPRPLPGCSDNHGINNPLQSAHPGGVLVGLVDGSVQFLKSSTDLVVLLRLAIRDDGQNVKWEE